jgi:hypothetical protein
MNKKYWKPILILLLLLPLFSTPAKARAMRRIMDTNQRTVNVPEKIGFRGASRVQSQGGTDRSTADIYEYFED